MQQQKEEHTGAHMAVEDVCDLCRITYSVYSSFPPMPSVKALNVETGEFFPFDRLRKMKSGYAMAEALGYAWACNCRGRAQKRFDEQFVLQDREGRALANVRYQIDTGEGKIISGTTDAAGKTQRVRSRAASRLVFAVVEN